jgi:hypothetical protein
MTEATAGAARQETGSDAEDGQGVECWCCGQRSAEQRCVRLGNHPEVAVCLACAHFLHQQARQREDALRPSIAARLRDCVRWGRRVVIDRGWHRHRLIGRPLRWLGRRLP